MSGILARVGNLHPARAGRGPPEDNEVEPCMLGSNCRHPLAGSHPEALIHRVGWRSYLPASVASTMTGCALPGCGKGLCRAGEARVAGRCWTARVQKAASAVATDGSPSDVRARSIRRGDHD